MIKKILVLLAITLSLGAVSACSLVGDKEEKETKNQEKSIGDNSSKVKEPEAEPVDLIKEKIKL